MTNERPMLGQPESGTPADLSRVLAAVDQAAGEAPTAELETALHLAWCIDRSLDVATYTLITELRQRQVTWERIAHALHVRTPQAVQSRYGTLRRRYGPR